MKLIILLACSTMIVTSSTRAQSGDLNLFYEQGTRWATVTSYSFPRYATTYGASLAEIGADSVISAHTYHLVRYNLDAVPTRLGAVRVDSQRVYFLNLSADTVFVTWPHDASSNSNSGTLLPGAEYLLYDYRIRMGDTVFRKVVQRIDSVQVNGISLRRFWFREAPGTFINDYWIEGIGSNLGFLGSYSGATPTYPGAAVFPRTFHYCAPTMFYEFSEISSGNVFGAGNCDLKPLTVARASTQPEIRVFPNPSDGDIHIELGDATLANELNMA